AGEDLPRIARRSVEAALRRDATLPPAPASEFLRGRAGVFVTIRSRSAVLRGCVGTLQQPQCPNIIEETWRNARLAAFGDGRFRAVEALELHTLRFGVSVLHSFEQVASLAELDPA